MRADISDELAPKIFRAEPYWRLREKWTCNVDCVPLKKGIKTRLRTPTQDSNFVERSRHTLSTFTCPKIKKIAFEIWMTHILKHFLLKMSDFQDAHLVFRDVARFFGKTRDFSRNSPLRCNWYSIGEVHFRENHLTNCFSATSRKKQGTFNKPFVKKYHLCFRDATNVCCR